MAYTLVSPVKGLLSKLTKQDKANMQLSLDRPLQSLSQEEPPSSGFETRSRSASHSSDTTLSTISSSGLATDNSTHSLQATIDTFRIDTAIALAVRAKQLDRQGNAEGAACLFAASLEHMSQALRDTGHLHDVHVRERLNMLRLLAAEPIDFSEISTAIDNRESLIYDKTVSQEAIFSYISKPDRDAANNENTARPNAYVSGGLALSQAADNLRSTLLMVAAYGMDLLNQLVILWLLLLGNLLVWVTNKFKQSDLPEISAQYLIRLGSWIYATGQEWNASEHIFYAEQKIVAWMVSLDNATGFSQRMIVSAASILAAIARVAEQSANKDTNDKIGFRSKNA
ncbi:hypothetical protein LPJ64_002149 [Coemansia asiatica]|uniref:Uncharacterized protein n=1 Tax=Coemansia asiatica TaxID=1052880 RepID=A0A9W7XMP4_9FUNG|nr:hypothetical protein LPJ64_002149 [Coemansia asiatica]